MIQPAATTPAPSLSLAAGGATGGDGAAFTLVLSAIGEDASGELAPISDDAPRDDDRQESAPDGNDLPDVATVPVFAWLPAVAVVSDPASPPPAIIVGPTSRAAPAITAGSNDTIAASMAMPTVQPVADPQTPAMASSVGTIDAGASELSTPTPDRLPQPVEPTIAPTSVLGALQPYEASRSRVADMPLPTTPPSTLPLQAPNRQIGLMNVAMQIPGSAKLSRAVTPSAVPRAQAALPLALAMPASTPMPALTAPWLAYPDQAASATATRALEAPMDPRIAAADDAAPGAPAAPAVLRAPTPTPPPMLGATMPAFQLFHAMRAAIDRDEPATATGTATDVSPPIALAAVELRHAVAATSDASQSSLDTGDGRWPHAMIDRIEQLRDAVDATDTRIRLIPDALGAVDVSIKRDGDTLHVHFAAEQAATRTLIQDAQPRLAAVAEERGLALGRTSVDAGGTGGGWADQQRRPVPEPRFAVTPPRAATADIEPVATGRLA